MEFGTNITIPWAYEVNRPYIVTCAGEDTPIIFECNEDSIRLALANQMRWCKMKFDTDDDGLCEVLNHSTEYSLYVRFVDVSIDGVTIPKNLYEEELKGQKHVATFRREIINHEVIPSGFRLIPEECASKIPYVRIGKFVK